MNLATTLKAEISRVARKELRGEVSTLKKALTKYRSDNADLKRRVSSLERLVGQLSKGSAKKPKDLADESTGTVARYSAKNMAALRKKLELSAADMGTLLGVSGASVYLWEQGKTRPRTSHMPAIATLRGMTKKSAAQKLAELK